MRVVFGTPEKPLAIEVPEGPIADGLTALFPDQRLLGSPAEPDLVVLPVDDGFALKAMRDHGSEHFDDSGALLQELEFGVTRFLLLGHRQQTHLHAAGGVLEREGKPPLALLALGESRAGKSTLALAMADEGLPLLGDDIVLLDDDGLVSPFRRMIHADRDCMLRLGVDPKAILSYDPGTGEAWYDPAGGAGWAKGPTRPAVIARIQWVANAPLESRRLGAGEGMELLLSSVLDSGVNPLGSTHRFLEALDGATVVDLRYGSAAEALAFLVALATD